MAITTSRRDALALLEETRKEYLEKARLVAERLAREGDGTVTVDDVRQEIPPPEGIDGRVMGAIFSTRNWEKLGYEVSRRRICHNRPIARFRLI